MKKRIAEITWLLVLIAAAAPAGFTQASSVMQDYLKQNIGLTQDEMTAIRNGQPVAKVLPSRTPDEIIVFGAVYVNADPAGYVKYAYDWDRLRKTPGYLAINTFSDPPKLGDLHGFELDSQDAQSLKSCKPGDCAIQLPGSTMEDLRKSINWSAPNVTEEVNQYIQNLALTRLDQYLKQGDKVLGAVYNDKQQQVGVADQFAYILSYAKAMPQNLPEFRNYLLSYPQGMPPNTYSLVYWDNVKFGLKPTLRIVQVVVMKGSSPKQPAYTIAEKQLYSSHYFETALNLTFCITDSTNPKQGFYLVQVMGSEQAGLTGFKGSMVRRVAVSHSVTDEQTSLTAVKNALEHK